MTQIVRAGAIGETQPLLEETLEEKKEERLWLPLFHYLPAFHWCFHRSNLAGNQRIPEPGKGSLQVSSSSPEQSRDQETNGPGAGTLTGFCKDTEHVRSLAQSKCSRNGHYLYAPMLCDDMKSCIFSSFYIWIDRNTSRAHATWTSPRVLIFSKWAAYLRNVKYSPVLKFHCIKQMLSFHSCWLQPTQRDSFSEILISEKATLG